MEPVDRFVRACRGEPVDRVPVWLMRQAGRYLPEYRRLRDRYPFLTLCKTPELAVEVSLQPIERFGLDAAILFSDILLLLETMGVELEFHESRGPLLGRRDLEPRTLAELSVPDPEAAMGFVFETIRQLKGALGGGTPLIGFSGAPFTLATYLIEGGSSKNFWATKSFMYQEPQAFHGLMERLSTAVARYLEAQIHAGADAVQVFDTWAVVLSPADYREFVLPHTRRVFEGLGRRSVPAIHFSLGASTLLDCMEETGADVIGLDWKIDLGLARRRLGVSRPVQGNLDPLALFQPAERLEGAVRDLLEKGAARPGYIFNLGHGIHPKTPVENVRKVVEVVRDHRPAGENGEGG